MSEERAEVVMKRAQQHTTDLIEASEKAYAYRSMPGLAVGWQHIRDARAERLLALVAEALSKEG